VIWETVADSGGAPEGTAVLSTGETGGTKYLREDGDNTCSWQAVTAVHDGTITWTGTSILETGAAFQFGDGTDATLTHTYANTGTDVSIAYSTGAMAVTGALSATNLSGTNTGDNTVATTGDSATSFFSSGVLEVGIGGTGATTLNDLITLTTHTSGNYVASANTSVLTGLTGGSAGSEGAALTIGLDYSQTLAGNPALGSLVTVMGTNGILFEGTTADTIEGLLTAPTITSSDKTWTLPDATGTIVLKDSTDTFTNKTVDANGTGNSYTNFDEDNMLNASDLVRDAIEFVISSSAAITTGIKGDIEVPYNCVIQRATVLADQSCSAVIDFWVDSYANYPPDNTDSITDAGTSLTISAATKAQDTSMTSWTTSLTAGDIIRYNIDSNDNATRLTISLVVEK